MRTIHSNRLTIFSWCLYDFANSPFTTLVITFIYATYFTQHFAATGNEGTVLWSRAITITGIMVALLSPVMGALADRGGYRKLFLFLFTALTVMATCGLYAIEPGKALLALTILVIANVAYEMGAVFYNAFLPDIAPPNKIGRISGYGWALGYVGGLSALVIALVGFVQPEAPWFGFAKEGGENIRATNLLVAAWFAVFSLPIFLWVKEDRSRREMDKKQIIAASYKQLVRTFTEIRKYRQIMLLLLARMFYNDGLITIFAFSAIYAKETFDFDNTEILVLAICLNVAAGLGAFVMGFMDDRLGGKRTIQISLIGLLIATGLAMMAPSKIYLWIGGILAGIFSGPNQAGSRSLMGRFVPPDKENEFYGFFAFSGKLTAFLGPFLFGLLTQLTGNQRFGVACVIGFFIIGYIILYIVDEEEGKQIALRESSNT